MSWWFYVRRKKSGSTLVGASLADARKFTQTPIAGVGERRPYECKKYWRHV
jgi:hypothetical protein